MEMLSHAKISQVLAPLFVIAQNYLMLVVVAVVFVVDFVVVVAFVVAVVVLLAPRDPGLRLV